MAQPLYTATATIVVDPRRIQIFGQAKQDNSVLGDTPVDSFSVDSLIATITSESVIRRAVKNLDFLNDPEFRGDYKNSFQAAIDSVIKLVTPEGPPATEEQKIRSAIDFIVRRLTVLRTGTSYAINMTYVAANNVQAARVLNAVADALVEDQQSASIEMLRATSSWLETRLTELRQRASDDARAVLKFKTENKLVDVSGAMVNDQQITQTMSQLSNARAQTGEMKARLDRIEDVIKANSQDATVSEALRNEVINRLLGQLADQGRRVAELTARYGENHGAVVAAHNDMRETRRAIASEVRRLAAGIRSDYEVAKAREVALERSIDSLVNETASSRMQQVRLRELESAAQSSRMLHDTLLQRYDLALQQESLPVSAVRLITRAAQPREKSWPKTPLLLAAAIVVGAGLGFAVALIRDMFDATVRNASQLENIIGEDCIAMVPAVTSEHQPWARRFKESGSQVTLQFASENPASRFSESFRRIRLVIDQYKASGSRVVGVVSSIAGEGKSTCVANLSSLLVRSGNKVLVIDADLRRPSLTQQSQATDRLGLAQVLSGAGHMLDIVLKGHLGGSDFIPAGSVAANISPGELVLSSNFALLVSMMREHYDYVIVDLPPLHYAADALAVAPHMDMFLYIVGWGETSESIIRSSLESSLPVKKKLAGAVLNKVDITFMMKMNPVSKGYAELAGYYHS